MVTNRANLNGRVICRFFVVRQHGLIDPLLWFVMLSVRVFAGFSAGFFVTTIMKSVSCRMFWQENPAYLYFFETTSASLLKQNLNFNGFVTFLFFIFLGDGR